MVMTARDWLGRIHALPETSTVRVLNVCGGHERIISMAGLRAALPPWVELIPGPGCPVCICPEEDIHAAIQIALKEQVILVAFGDMLRVPVNVPKGELRSLEQAKAAGADVRPVASPLDAVTIARAVPDRLVVFFAAGFETTMAPVAAMIAQGLPNNFHLLLSGRRTWPAVAMLLNAGIANFQALIAPGHVSTVMGPEEWNFVAEQHCIPVAVAGFTPTTLLAALYSVLRQNLERRFFLDNCYPEVVRPGGNLVARRLLDNILEVVAAPWRGIGIIPDSGYALRHEHTIHDARRVFPVECDVRMRRGADLMPPGCDCAEVVLGRRIPSSCRLYGTACSPRNPVGPCMVSEEGACRVWWASGLRMPQLNVRY
ncbi:Hydrogenase maturation factor [Gammaproteobacteria bacterium]